MFSSAPPPCPCRHVGVTLIELMIVVAVIAILSAIAYPSYLSYVQRGNIPEAFSELAQLRIQLEQYYQDHRTYGTLTGTQCGTSDTILIPVNSAPAGTSYFTYKCSQHSDAVSEHYILTATGVTDKGMSGYAYTLDYAGNKQTTKYAGATVSKNCWMLKSGDC